MPLSPVDELSDDGAARNQGDDKTTGQGPAPPAPSPKPKPKPKSKKSGVKATVKAGSSVKASEKVKASPMKKPSASEETGESTLVLKRPSALRAPQPPAAPVKVGKGLYKNGKYGFKVDGKEVFHAARLCFS